MQNNDILPVLLGSDANVYGMARSFHQEYGVCSIAISKTIFTATVDSKIITFVLEPDLENEEKFLKTLLDVAKKHQDKKLVLVPCGDGYVKLVVRFQKELREFFCFNCLSEELLKTLTLKESFYDICEKYGFDHPKTQVISKENYKTETVKMKFPVVVKASNSVKYWQCSFQGKMKVFVAQDKPEYERITDAIYASTYDDHLTIQEFIPGDDSYMRVLNCYVGTDKKVKLMALGHALLEEHTPQGIGSYVAIYNTYDEKLLQKFKYFLEDIGYTGFANFDMKLDIRDGKYKVFETNVRQGRSSFFVTASGYNLAKYLVEDVVYHKNTGFSVARNKFLWIQVPKGIIRKYVKNPECVTEINQLLHQKKCLNSLFYKPDLKLSRRIKLTLN
ncbi:MAG: ATP-grasp domain-containing protein, partial [Oscillospiraceae bacterium]